MAEAQISSPFLFRLLFIPPVPNFNPAVALLPSPGCVTLNRQLERDAEESTTLNSSLSMSERERRKLLIKENEADGESGIGRHRVRQRGRNVRRLARSAVCDNVLAATQQHCSCHAAVPLAEFN